MQIDNLSVAACFTFHFVTMCNVKLIAGVVVLFVCASTLGTEFPLGSGVESWKSSFQILQKRVIDIPIVVYGQIDHLPGRGNRVGLRGEVNLLQSQKQNLSLWGQHSRIFNEKQNSASAANTLGLSYRNQNGGTVFVSGTREFNGNSYGSMGADIPVINNNITSLGITGQTDFGKDMLPISHSLGFKLVHTL